MEVFAREPCRRRCANETRSNVRTSMFQGFGSPSALQVNALWLRVLSGGQCVLRHLEWWLNHLPWSSDAGLVGHDTEAVHQWSLNCINTKSSLTTIISFCRSFSRHVRDPWRGYYYYAQQYNRCSIDRKYSCSNPLRRYMCADIHILQQEPQRWQAIYVLDIFFVVFGYFPAGVCHTCFLLSDGHEFRRQFVCLVHSTHLDSLCSDVSELYNRSYCQINFCTTNMVVVKRKQVSHR